MARRYFPLPSSEFDLKHIDAAQVRELRLIVACCYMMPEQAQPFLKGQRSLSGASLHYLRWAHFDMTDCAESWCRRVRSEKEDQVSLWNATKAEMHSLLCTSDPRYTAVRKQLHRMLGTKSQLAIVSTTAAALSPHIGVAMTTVLIPLCAVCLLAGIRIGQNAICSRLSETIDFAPVGVPLGTGERLWRSRVGRIKQRRSKSKRKRQ